MNEKGNRGYFSSFSFFCGEVGSANKMKNAVATEKKLKELKKLTNYEHTLDISRLLYGGFFIGFISYFIAEEFV